MISTEMLRRLLAVADVRQDPYAVADVSAQLLQLDARDEHAARHYLRSLAALEMGQAAGRMLPWVGEAVRAELQAMLEKLPAGVIPWTSRRRRFQANLRALEQRGIASEPLLAAWAEPGQKNAERYELHGAADGNFQILDTRPDEASDPGAAPVQPAGAGPRAAAPPIWKSWLGGLQNCKGAVAAITREGFNNQLRGPMAFDGIGFGWLIPHILEISEKSFLNYSAAMYIVEPDVVSFCMTLHLHDLQKWLASPRLRLFIGPDARDRFTRSLRENAGWSLPVSFAFNPLRPRVALELQTAVEGVLAHRGEMRRQTLERIEKHYAGIDGAAWRRRYAEAISGGAPLRVLGVTTRYSTVLRYSMEELQSAAGGPANNLQMEICMEPDDHSLEKDYLGVIDRLKPDLLVTISRMRHEMPDLPRNIPALCWDQDNLQCMRDPAARADMKGLTFVAGHGAVFGSMHLNWPLPACIFCHPAGMTHRYRAAPPTEAEWAQFGADVSYVSHASGSPEELRNSLRVKWVVGGKEFIPLFDACADEMLQSCRNGREWEHLELCGLIARVASEKGLRIPVLVMHALPTDLRLLADRVFRHETLGWVARWCESRHRRLRIWGNGWSAHPTLGKWAAGAALPGEQAQAVYRASRLNLQIIGTGVIHSRLLDGWAAGGFFLMRQAHRSQDEVRMATCHRIGQLARVEGIQTISEILSRGSVQLQKLWNTVAGEYLTCDASHEFPGLRMWRELEPPQSLFPGLDQVMFNDAAGFEVRADRFVESADRREEFTRGVRKVLEERLSYDARWRDFIGHMAAHLGYVPAQEGSGAAIK